ncbi:MAG: prepilin-type N-terminal cleavage/methylation domain-containing protein [Gemmatales bacterium]|nr:prepilin-type N-terminal cleavage/methylation domain-containing protein [Gemmatales bacterium]MDW7995787.1 prepilin-type N-terminal cleavage/methylation domain-containing protein [Gemmatales bacterium]
MLRHRLAKRAAFTLMELLVVLMIVLALMMLAAPITLYFGRSHVSTEAANRLSAGLSEAHMVARAVKTMRGIALTRSSSAPANLPAEYRDEIQEVELRLLRLPEGGSPACWMQYPGFVSTTAGRNVFHSRVASFYRWDANAHSWQPDSLLAKSPPLYDPQNAGQGVEFPLYVEVNGQAQTRLVAGLPSSTAPGPLPLPPNRPGHPSPDESQVYTWDPQNPGWQAPQGTEQPILQSHQVLLARGLAQLHLHPPIIAPSKPPNYLRYNYQLLSLCPLPKGYIQGTNPPQFQNQRLMLRPGTAINLRRSIPNDLHWSSVPNSPYFPAGTPFLIFGESGSVVYPGNAFLADKTLNGWIVFWVGWYQEADFSMRPEDSVLVGVHTRTGRIATFQVNLDRNLGDEYHYVRWASPN